MLLKPQSPLIKGQSLHFYATFKKAVLRWKRDENYVENAYFKGFWKQFFSFKLYERYVKRGAWDKGGFSV